MALQSINKHGIIMTSFGEVQKYSGSNATMDAVGESFAGIGQIFLEGGASGGTKTLSSGKIYFLGGTTQTFANAGTTLRVGLQDVSSTTGLEDTTFDVYQDLVGGTDTITASVVNIITMDSGTKTLTHGDVVAVCFEMLSRGGTDQVTVSRYGPSAAFGSGLPYCTADTGTLGKITNAIGVFIIEFDDGTLGWFNPCYYLTNKTATAYIDVASSDTPDEYAAVFQVPFKCSINAGAFYVGSGNDGRTQEIILYSDPLGTPAVVEAVALDEMYSNVGLLWVKFSEYTLNPNTNYAIAIRPTSINTIRIYYSDLGDGNEKLKTPTDFGVNCLFCSRTNQTGAFAEVYDHYLPLFGISVSKLDDGGPTKEAIAQATWEYGNRTLT
jgi:hypothetical protein